MTLIQIKRGLTNLDKKGQDLYSELRHLEEMRLTDQITPHQTRRLRWVTERLIHTGETYQRLTKMKDQAERETN